MPRNSSRSNARRMRLERSWAFLCIVPVIIFRSNAGKKRAGLRRPFVVEACGALYGRVVTVPNAKLNVKVWLARAAIVRWAVVPSSELVLSGLGVDVL